MSLAVITSHFNPVGWRAPVRNFLKFKEQMRHVPFFSVELSFDDHFAIPDALHIRGTEQNNMWQKERLLNILIDQLPEYDAFAWVDADVIFKNPNWYSETERLLEHHPVVQMFSRIGLQNKHGDVDRTLPSCIYQYEHDGKFSIAKSKPGYAWAARREAIPGGLLDTHIIGGADTIMIQAWYGIWDSPHTKMNKAWRKHTLEQMVPYYRSVKGDCTYLDSEIVHLYHGSERCRQYRQRNKYLTEHNYDPEQDIRLDDNGLWMWSSDKPDMHRQVATYFIIRSEDH